MKFASVRRAALMAGLLLTNSIQASPFYGINLGSSRIQARDLSIDPNTCTPFVVGNNNKPEGKVCVSKSGNNLIVTYSALSDGCIYNNVHVYIGTSPPTDRNPGGFPYSSDPGGVCTISTGGATATCTIPIQNAWRLCEKTLYISTHGSVTCTVGGGQTGWGSGPCFGNGGGNCAKYWTFKTHCYCSSVSVFPQQYSTSTSIYTSTSITEYLTSTTITYATNTVSEYDTSTTITYPTNTVSEYDTSTTITYPTSTTKTYDTSTTITYETSSTSTYVTSTTVTYDTSTTSVYPTSTTISYDTSTTSTYATSTTISYDTSTTSTYATSTTISYDTSTTSLYSVTKSSESIITSVTVFTLPPSSTTIVSTCTNPYP